MNDFKGDELRVRTQRSDIVGRRDYDYDIARKISHTVKNGIDSPIAFQHLKYSRRVGKDRRVS